MRDTFNKYNEIYRSLVLAMILMIPPVCIFKDCSLFDNHAKLQETHYKAPDSAPPAPEENPKIESERLYHYKPY